MLHTKLTTILAAVLLALAGCKTDSKQTGAKQQPPANQTTQESPAPAGEQPGQPATAPATGPTAAQPEAPATAPTAAATSPAEAAQPTTAPTAATPEGAPAASPGEVKPAEGEKPAEAAPGEAKPAEPASEEAKLAEEAKAKMEERRQRIQEIYAYGRSDKPEDEGKLAAIIKSEAPVYERASAIRALGRDRRDKVVEDLKTMADDKATAVRIEAAIKLYQWGEHGFALPKLKELRTQGVALRRAFQTGYEDGKPTYDKNALAFFKDGVKNENVYVRLDSAVGMIELGKANAGLPVVKKVLEEEDKYHIRMAAVNYLTPLKRDPAVKELLEMATKDKDERVSKRAANVLGIPLEPAPAEKKAEEPPPAEKPIEPAPAGP